MKKIKQVLAIMIAYILHFFIKPKAPIILLGGHDGKLYADNASVMYEYLVKKNSYNVFWIIDKDSLDFNKPIRKINRGSIKNYIYYFNSKVVLFSHSASDVAPIAHKFSRLGKPYKICLEHGITGLKRAAHRVNTDPSLRQGPDADKVICANQIEKEIKENFWNIPNDQLVLTGFPRYDRLIKPSRLRKEILFMPTWREWLENEDFNSFKDTFFFKDIISLFENPRLKALCNEHDYKFKVYIHFYFHKFFETFTNIGDHIELIAINDNVQDYLINSQILITDYSSVAWDFYYLDKPVLFYQPDIEKYEKERGSYLDLRTELFGDVSYDHSTLLDQVQHTLINFQTQIEKYSELKEKYFDFNDQNNCSRIESVILSLLKLSM